MSAMWDRLKTGNYGGGPAAAPHKPQGLQGGAPQHQHPHQYLDTGAGSAKGAYYRDRAANPSSHFINSTSNPNLGIATNTSNLNFAAGAKGYSYSIKGGPAPPRPPRQFLEQQQHDETPPVQAPPPRNPQRESYRNSALRPTSSIYSQPSPINTNFHASNSRRTREAEDISPPSSPEALTPRDGWQPHRLPSPDISPIDEDPSQREFQMSQPNYDPNGQQGRSNIPMMRRDRRHQQEAAARTLRESKSKERLQQQVQNDTQMILSQRGFKAGKGEVRWDPSTGELTNSTKGRPSQVKPAEFAKGFGNSPGGSSPPQQRQADQKPSTTPFGDRMRSIARGGPVDRSQEPLQQLHQQQQPPQQPQSPVFMSATDPAAGAFSSERPAWHGASGRTTLVAPVRDTTEVTSLMNIPRKSSKRAATSRIPSGAMQPGGPHGLDTIMASPPVSPPPGAETLGRETIRQVVPSSQLPKQPPQQTQAYPSPPLSGDISQGSSARDLLPSQDPSSSNANHHQIKRKPAVHHPQDSVSSVYSQSDPFNYNHYTAVGSSSNVNNFSADRPPPPPAHQEWTQPPSRFSVTTYDATPRESLDEFDARDAPPVPSVADMFRPDHAHHLQLHGYSPSANKLQESMMDRRRPPKMGPAEDTSAIAFDDPIVISLDPWTTSLGGAKREDTRSRPGRRAPDAGSVHKVLPPAPPEQSAKDRVAQLNAQLAGLSQRRINITRSIDQMTKLMPTDSIMASAEVIHKREMEKRKVEGLRTELAEVQREEYELGLKLHRAYKRLDRDAEFEPTTLWVRRVTG